MGTCYSTTSGDADDVVTRRIQVRQPGEEGSVAARGQNLPACKVVLLGNTATGKTSLLQRFTRDNWDECSTATIGAAFTSHVVDLLDGRSLQLDIWDTAGQERYRSLAPLYYRNASAAVVVFDITQRDTFEGCVAWITDFQQMRPGSPIVLVGNKMDIEDRAVSQEEARALADDKQVQYIETSAKEDVCVSEMFELVACAVLERITAG